MSWWNFWKRKKRKVYTYTGEEVQIDEELILRNPPKIYYSGFNLDLYAGELEGTLDVLDELKQVGYNLGNMTLEEKDELVEILEQAIDDNDTAI